MPNPRNRRAELFGAISKLNSDAVAQIEAERKNIAEATLIEEVHKYCKQLAKLCTRNLTLIQAYTDLDEDLKTGQSQMEKFKDDLLNHTRYAYDSWEACKTAYSKQTYAIILEALNTLSVQLIKED